MKVYWNEGVEARQHEFIQYEWRKQRAAKEEWLKRREHVEATEVKFIERKAIGPNGHWLRHYHSIQLINEFQFTFHSFQFIEFHEEA